MLPEVFLLRSERKILKFVSYVLQALLKALVVHQPARLLNVLAKRIG
jgi:hypothetical protein